MTNVEVLNGANERTIVNKTIAEGRSNMVGHLLLRPNSFTILKEGVILRRSSRKTTCSGYFETLLELTIPPTSWLKRQKAIQNT